jgi:hypothetical protein
VTRVIREKQGHDDPRTSGIQNVNGISASLDLF